MDDDSLDACWHLSAMARRERERANAARHAREIAIMQRIEAAAKRIGDAAQEIAPKSPTMPGIAQSVAAWLHKHITPMPTKRQWRKQGR